MGTDLLADLTARRLVHQVSSPALAAQLRQERLTGYIGFDPTAPSLHVGSLLPVLTLVRLQRAGHRPIALVGGATGLIGDPSGKQAERSLLDADTLARNLAGLRAQLERFLDFRAGDAVLVDNAEWLGAMGLIPFLRDVGKHFSVNAMVTRDAVRTRLEEREQGISFTEFSYILLQAYDFLALHDRFGCTLQLGGSDQWGNIVSGMDLIRRLRNVDAWGLTFPLVTRADGTKFGKSEQGNLWLDPALTSPYQFYQFWLNTDDRDVERYLPWFTLLPMDALEAALHAHAQAPQARAAQRLLAEEVTRFVHGDAGLARARRTTAVFFQGLDYRALPPDELAETFRDAPASTLPRAALGTAAAGLVALLADAGLYPSRTRARQDVEKGGVSLNDTIVRDVQKVVTEGDLLPGGFAVVRKGRKTFHVLRVV